MDTAPNPEQQASPTTQPPQAQQAPGDTERSTNGERPRTRDDGDRAPVREARHWFTIAELNDMKLAELRKAAEGLGVKDAKDGKQEELVMRVLQAQTEQQGYIFAQGILEIVEDGFGFLRQRSLLPSPNDVYVSSSQIRRFGLRTGDTIDGHIRSPKEGER